MMETLIINPFHVNDLFRYPLKTSENQRYSSVLGIERDQWHELSSRVKSGEVNRRERWMRQVIMKTHCKSEFCILKTQNWYYLTAKIISSNFILIGFHNVYSQQKIEEQTFSINRIISYLHTCHTYHICWLNAKMLNEVNCKLQTKEHM